MSAPGVTPQAPAVKVARLTKRFDQTNAVNNIEFTVPAGSITALLGGNGAGKTTTLSMLLGILMPTSGEISVYGIDMLTDRHRALPRINFSSPYVGLPMRLTVVENLIVYANLYGLAGVKQRVDYLMDELGLAPFRKTPVGRLSAGEKTRVALAKALVNEPALLLLDEPTASMDPDTADWIRDYFESYRRRTGAAILLASHNMIEVERLCDQVLMMRAGKIVERGTPAELTARYERENLEQVFLDIARDEGSVQPHAAS